MLICLRNVEVAIICPKWYIISPYLHECVDLSNIAKIAMQDWEQEADATSLRIMDHVVAFWWTSLRLHELREIVVKWAWERKHTKLYSDTVASFMNKIVSEPGMKTVAGIASSENTQKSTEVDWDK